MWLVENNGPGPWTSSFDVRLFGGRLSFAWWRYRLRFEVGWIRHNGRVELERYALSHFVGAQGRFKPCRGVFHCTRIME